MKINEAQRKFLLSRLRRERVSQRDIGRGKQASYLEAYDIRRTLIRVFGFGNFDIRTVEVEQVVDQFGKAERTKNGQKHEIDVYTVGYRATVELRVHGTRQRTGDYPVATDPDTVYSASAVGVSSNQPDLGQAHDHALKTAESDALKRAAMNLGTQFGLSLYQDGQLADIVHLTLDVDGLPEQVADEQVVAEDQTPAAPTEAEAPQEERPNVGTEDLRIGQVLEQLRATYEIDNKAERLIAIGQLRQSVPNELLSVEVDVKGGKATVETLFERAGKDANRKAAS